MKTLQDNPPLKWPVELADSNADEHAGFHWFQSNSNYSLDFHGDPVKADLVVFSDGNHHMALQDVLAEFKSSSANLKEIFYATTPPGVLLQCMMQGSIRMGNLVMSRQPDIFIGPAPVLDKLIEHKKLVNHQPFMKSKGNVLLVSRGNPKSIAGIADLLRDDVRFFISNPDTETASYNVYKSTLLNLATEQVLDLQQFETMVSGSNVSTVFGDKIHHRELPQAIYQGSADVAMVYYHLALRYLRIFPDCFEIVPLGGTVDAPAPSSGNIRTNYHLGVVNETNRIAANLYEFMFSDSVTRIYQHHGLERP